MKKPRKPGPTADAPEPRGLLRDVPLPLRQRTPHTDPQHKSPLAAQLTAQLAALLAALLAAKCQRFKSRRRAAPAGDISRMLCGFKAEETKSLFYRDDMYFYI